MTIRVTISKPAVYNSYGILMTLGTIYTVDDDFGRSLIQSLKATDTDFSLVTPGVGQGTLGDIIFINAASIAAPTAAILGNITATYALDVAPYTRYQSTGTALVAAGGGGGSGSFVDAEVPTGTINGANASFTLSQSPSPAASLELYRNGVLQTAGGTDYTLSSTTITYVTAPNSGDTHVAYYRY
jgi:hypothetical protein